jgi:hypothetical protein
MLTNKLSPGILRKFPSTKSRFARTFGRFDLVRKSESPSLYKGGTTLFDK